MRSGPKGGGGRDKAAEGMVKRSSHSVSILAPMKASAGRAATGKKSRFPLGSLGWSVALGGALVRAQLLPWESGEGGTSSGTALGNLFWKKV